MGCKLIVAGIYCKMPKKVESANRVCKKTYNTMCLVECFNVLLSESITRVLLYRVILWTPRVFYIEQGSQPGVLEPQGVCKKF